MELKNKLFENDYGDYDDCNVDDDADDDVIVM